MVTLVGHINPNGALATGLLPFRSSWKTGYGVANSKLRCGLGVTYRFEMEAQTGSLVLDRDDHHCGAPCRVDLVDSLDH